MVVLSIGAISAQDTADAAIVSDGTDSGLNDSRSVSGSVDLTTENPWNTTGVLSYDIPADAKAIKSADVYVNVYSGSAKAEYGANANITITTDNNNATYFESLWIDEGSTDGTVYTVNDHTTKCYSDFMIHYDITSMLDGLNGTNLKINVDTFKMENKSFDGRIKLIALILAYDDGDNDVINYWINDDQLWSKSNVTITFDTDSVKEFNMADLYNVVLSSGDGIYKLNGNNLTDPYIHESGNYYQVNAWNIPDKFIANQKTDLNVMYAGTSAYGSIKNVLSVLVIANMTPLETEISVSPEYTSVPSIYAGTNNTLTVKVKTSKAGKYDVKLFADGVEVDGVNVDLAEGENTVLLTDPTIRPVDASTVNAAENKVVNYTVVLVYKNYTVDYKKTSFPVLYNGNLGSEYEYNITGFEEIGPITVTGEFIIDVQDVSSYLGASAMNRTDVWEIYSYDGETITNAYIYVPYNWFNAKTYTEDVDMFNVTFNGVSITPVAWYRDQGNLGNYGKYGYGVLVYDVTDLIVNGDNSFVLNKINPTPAVYPSVLVYLYNITDNVYSTTVSILNGADLLSNSNNNAGRIVSADTVISANPDDILDADLIVLAAGAQAGESDIVFNGEVFSNVWNGTSSSTDLFYADVTGLINESNSVSFVATGSTILVLPQFIVTTTYVGSPKVELSIAPEYTSVPCAYAGTNNTITVNVKTSETANYTIKLYADGVLVDSADVVLVEGDNTVLLTDPTIRPVDASTVNGAENNMVEYYVKVGYHPYVIATKKMSVPILYNGNLGSDYEYNITGFDDEVSTYYINGDFIIDVQDESSYLGASAMNRTDVWEIKLDDKFEFTDAFIYVPYNWFNAKTYTEDINMFNVTFNGVSITPVAWYRDQGNLGNYGKYGYGVLVYDVSDLIAVGNNSFVLNKVNPTPAVYPSALVYMYNTTGITPMYSTVSILNGADLLSNSNNKAGRTVSADTVIAANTDNITNAFVVVLAAGAQAGESDIVFNGEVYSNVWNGTSSSTDLFYADVGSLVNESNSVSFVATGSTILALPQFIVTSQYIGPKTELSIAPEYTNVPCAYAGTNNTISVKVKTSQTANFTVVLYADGVIVDSADVVLVEGDNTVLLTDPTIRPVDASTVNGAENNIVDYHVEVVYEGFILNDKEMSLPVLYNGNLGSDYEYNITGFEEFDPITVSGYVVFEVQDESSYLGASAMNRTDVWKVYLYDDSTITNAYIYVPYNWFNAKTYTEDINMFNVTFNGVSITPIAWYRDQGNLGNYGKYGYGVLVYDVADLIAVGDNEFVLNKINPTPAVYPSVLVFMYNTTGSLYSTTVSILNGADLLSNSSNNAGRIVSADTVISADPDGITGAILYVLAAGAQAGESDIVFNGEVFSNVWTGSSTSTDLFFENISRLINESNSVSFVATGSTILALPQFIVTTTYVGPKTELSIAPEYTSVPCAYAGTNNTVTVKVKTSQTANYTVVLYADGLFADSVDVVLVEGDNTVLLTDPTIRPVDASTVNGAENNMVEYYVDVVYNDIIIDSEEMFLPVLYNGNLGSDYEYNITGFEEFAPITVTGDVVIDVKDVSSYLGTSAMNRTDDWEIVLDDDSTITNAYVYVPYNWFNAKAYTEGIDMFNVTFNGAAVTPVAWYRDQGNLGNYGKYGYGVLVYDVGDLIAVGDNEFVLNKVNPTPAVYPSVLVYMYNTTGTSYTKTVYALNGADLLSNANNNAGRIVKADTEMSIDSSEIEDAILYVLAAGAQAGESDIVFNGEVYSNVWNGTSSTTDLFSSDVTGLVNDVNSISFVATGSTILELSQFIVISKSKIDTNISAPDVNVVYGDESGEFIATLTDAYGTPIVGADVVVSLNGEDYALNTNDDGQVSVSTADLPVGTYAATISYDGDSAYKPASATAEVSVKVNMVISAVYDSDNKQIVATLTNNDTGKPVTGAKVNVDINGVETTVNSNSKGKVVISTADLAYGDYTATISYAGNAKYNPASTSVDFGIKEGMIISAVYDSVNKQIVATLTNNVTGNAVANAKVNVDINGVNTTVKSNSKGKVVISTADLPADDYTATISYAGNAKYVPVSTSIDFSTKAAIIISDVYGSDSELTATLTNSLTGKKVINANVVVDINGVNTTVKSNSNGKIKVPVTGLTDDTYAATISYRGNANYNAVSTTTTVDLTKANMIITAEYDSANKQVVGTLTNANTGKVIVNANVNVQLNGVTTTVKSNSKGQVIVSTADLDAGNYVAILSYQGNAKYNQASTVANVAV